MTPSVEVLGLVCAYVQQYGVLIAVGAETMVLGAYLLAIRDGVISATEGRFSAIVHIILTLGIWALIASGVIITVVHGMLAQSQTVLSPVFLFKWVLLVALSSAYFIRSKQPFMHYALEGLVGANWYALLLVHVFHPVITWASLLELYAIWLIGFMLCWTGVIIIIRDQRLQTFVRPGPMLATTNGIAMQVPSSAYTAPIIPPQSHPAGPIHEPAPQIAIAPTIPAPVIVAQESAQEQAEAPEAPVLATPGYFDRPVPVEHHGFKWLPAIHVMPQSIDELHLRHRDPVAKDVSPQQ